ncbi:MAG: hypothetical protein ABS43_01685 [Bordetella sp. SCN 67-23]|nr:helix-turn-helix transcriptional regulator [Burkholderiales bacterium]ODS76283.1 MAG: hypothetical protein ABS43_01685 [Bordetella sp. SCN 67-23]OJW90086.1 MAG: hypothetical protein BGO71_27620 [Burkholderiales bacterium 67-32]
MTLGKRIKERRKDLQLTLQDVATAFGISKSSVSDWERDETRPDIDRLVKLARMLRTSTDHLLTGSTSGATGWWPFSARFEDYLELSSAKREQLDDRVSSFIEGATDTKSPSEGHPGGRETDAA